MPQMSRAFGGWTQSITVTMRIQCVVDGLVTYKDNSVSFRGTVQPLSPKAIALKPEGQRAWSWLHIHCYGNPIFDVNDQIIYNGDLYKVMAQNDYSLNGFTEYHLVHDYQS